MGLALSGIGMLGIFLFPYWSLWQKANKWALMAVYVQGFLMGAGAVLAYWEHLQP